MKLKGTLDELILAYAELDAIKILLSFVITFIFWFALAIAVLVLFHLRSGEMAGYLTTLEKVVSFLGLLGVSVGVLTASTWKIILKLIYKYIGWYTKKHTQSS